MSRHPVRWFGSRAVVVELGSLEQALALYGCLLKNPLPGQVDLVPATKTLLVCCDSHYSAVHAYKEVADIEPPPVQEAAGRSIEIEVVYDGEDLEAVAAMTGLGVDGVIAAHTGQTWQAAFSGFAPGFVYLAAENDQLNVPRRDSPRIAVPAGSVALAGCFGAVYPHQSPGGWQLIGRTNARLWDLERDPPALIQAGDRIRYVAVDALTDDMSQTVGGDNQVPTDGTAAAGGIEVINPGIQSLVEDTGRPGLSHLGVPVSGAADARAARQANDLVGNAAGAAVIETLLGGLAISARRDLVLARTGALGQARIDGVQGTRHAPYATPFILHDRETLTLDTLHHGVRSYVGVRGGLAVARSLGSRSGDVMSNIGPGELWTGQVLPVGEAQPSQVVGADQPPARTLFEKDVVVLRVIWGPRDDWFSTETQARLLRQNWIVTEQSNRVGVRFALDDEDNNTSCLTRCRAGELDTEGMQPGALQVPPSGLPVLFLKDHPVTGGYPVIAAVIAQDLPVAAQISPGQAIRFVAVDPDTLLPAAAATSDDVQRMIER